MNKIAVSIAALVIGGAALTAGAEGPGEEEIATGYYRAQAEEGSPYAQLALGEIYYYGELVAKDLVKAYAWLAVSAHQEVPEAASLRAKIEQEMNAEERARAAPLAAEYIEMYVAPRE